MFDNLVKLTQEKGIQKNIAIKLLAINLVTATLMKTMFIYVPKITKS